MAQNSSISAGLYALAWAVMLSTALAAVDRGTSRPEEDPPPPIRIVVLPFQNGTGDAAWDDWQQALPGLARSFLKEATPFNVRGWKRIQPTVKRLSWNAKTSDAELARQIAADLNSSVAVWGQFMRRTNACIADLMVWRTNSSVGLAKLQATSSNWVGLAESIAMAVAKHLGSSIAEGDRRYWRSQLPESSGAEALLGKAIALSINDAPRTSQEKVLRELLLADKRCAFAYTSLRNVLADQERKDEIEKLATDFLRERPDVCDAHLSVAALRLMNGDENAAERGMREALRQHPGCPGAVRGLSALLMQRKTPVDARKMLEEAHEKRPQEVQTRILLACARAFDNDKEGARRLLRTIDELPPEDLFLDTMLFTASALTDNFELVGLELLRLGPQAVTNEVVADLLSKITLTNREKASVAGPANAAPRKFTPPELQAELARRLSSEERALVANPVEVTPELTAEAIRLTAGLPDDVARIIALFSEVAQRGRGRNQGARHTADGALKASRNPQNRFVCQEYAKLFVGLVRALGIDAWLVHIDRDAFGYPCYHDCAAVVVDGEILLIDPTWRVMGIKHQEFVFLDDVQAISHHAMQRPDSKIDPRKIRAGLKLNPDDRWTRVQFVRGMAWAGQYDAAAGELRKLQTGPETWDIHQAAADVHAAQQRWREALESLQRALVLSPSNAAIHLEMARAYDLLGNEHDSDKHAEAALRLDRGEISAEMREFASFRVALGQTLTQLKSGSDSSRQALQAKAEAGDVTAQFALARISFEEGPAGFDEGFRWLRKAAAQGNAPAQLNYAVNLIRKDGLDAGTEPVKWLTYAAEQGLDDAQYQLGLILYEGKLVPRDMTAAYSWITLAAGQGSKDAKTLLKELDLFIRPDDAAEARKRAAAFIPKKSTPVK